MLIFLCSKLALADDYIIYLLGIPIVGVNMELSKNSLEFYTETKGLMNSFWPVSNTYFTEFDSISFGIRKYKKTIIQGKYQGELDCNYEYQNSQLRCGNSFFTAADSIQNIFTLIARIAIQNKSSFNSTWFPMNHEGLIYRARFTWIDIEEINIKDGYYICDHYILDLEKIDEKSIYISPWDYFTDHIRSDNVVRELWVSKSRDKKIIKSSVKLYGMTIVAEIQN